MNELVLSFLGVFDVRRAGRPLTGFESCKVRALLAYLALQPARAHNRDELAGLLWPQSAQRAARQNLRQALANLRRVLGEDKAERPFLLVEHDAIQVNPDHDFELDVQRFTTFLAACRDHTHRRAAVCRSCAARREAAVALYEDDLLAHFFVPDSPPFEEWLLVARERLRQLALAALFDLAMYYEHENRPDVVERHARRQLEIDPWREEAHQQLMRALAAQGQRGAARQQFWHCRQVLRAEMGVEPGASTRALAAEIDGSATTTPGYAPPWTFNLARPLLPLIGRQAERAALVELLDEAACRLVTLTGPGGVGKTRLAQEVALDMAGAFADGAGLVNLAPLATPEALPAAIAAALAPLSAERPSWSQLHEILRARQMLLVLENFEHLLAARTDLLELLTKAPGLTVLVTSEERLNVAGEWVVAVGGLPLTATDGEVAPATALFAQRARQRQPAFRLSEINRAAVATICRLVEGLPLAIEVAASWVNVMSCPEIAVEIERGLGFLADQRPPGSPARGLRAVFDHTWGTLTGPEQAVFAALSVFRGGFDRAAAERVAGASLPRLAALVDKSLLRRGDDGRYSLHLLWRHYAAERLDTAGATGAVRDRHLAYFLDWLDSHPATRNGWPAGVGVEHNNLAAALAWAAVSGAAQAADRLAAALSAADEHLRRLQEIPATVAEPL